MEGCKRIESLGSTKALRSISWLAWVYHNQDYLEKAIELQTFVAEESVHVLGPDTLDTLLWKEELTNFQEEASQYNSDKRSLSDKVMSEG